MEITFQEHFQETIAWEHGSPCQQQMQVKARSRREEATCEHDTQKPLFLWDKARLKRTEAKFKTVQWSKFEERLHQNLFRFRVVVIYFTNLVLKADVMKKRDTEENSKNCLHLDLLMICFSVLV